MLTLLIVDDYPAVIWAAPTSLAPFTSLLKMLIQAASRLIIGLDMLVNTLMACRIFTLATHESSHLFSSVIFAQIRLDCLLNLEGESFSLTAFQTTRCS